VLGLLAQEPMSGYDIRRYLRSLNWLVDSPSFGSLYPTLRTLLEEGLVTVDIVLRRDKPACKIYSVTRDGAAALEEWLEQPAPAESSLKTFVKRLVLAGNLSGSRLIADLEQRRAQISSHQALLERAATSLDEGADRKRRLALDYGLAMAEAETAWIDETLQSLSQPRENPGPAAAAANRKAGSGGT
jgi:PadR family transcriptional regulator AphA